jgi:hypothetical protein
VWAVVALQDEEVVSGDRNEEGLWGCLMEQLGD